MSPNLCLLTYMYYFTHVKILIFHVQSALVHFISFLFLFFDRQIRLYLFVHFVSYT